MGVKAACTCTLPCLSYVLYGTEVLVASVGSRRMCLMSFQRGWHALRAPQMATPCIPAAKALAGYRRVIAVFAGSDASMRLARRFDGFAEETVTVQRLPGWFKQRSNRLYPVRAPARGQTPHLPQRL